VEAEEDVSPETDSTPSARSYRIDAGRLVQNLEQWVPPEANESRTELLVRFLKENQLEITPPDLVFLDEQSGKIWLRTTPDKAARFELLLNEKLMSRGHSD
jgi:hypothetical protein